MLILHDNVESGNAYKVRGYFSPCWGTDYQIHPI